MKDKQNNKPSSPHKLGITFTNKQVELLQILADEGLFGSTPTEVAYRLVILSLLKRFE